MPISLVKPHIALGVLIEVEFVAGTWTNVTAAVDWGAGVTVHVGRQAKGTAPSASTLSLTLRNPTGRFTPGLQQCSDGTLNPYYPNVRQNKRIRYSNAAGVRFLGRVQAWQPSMVNGVLGSCDVQAIDDMDRLSRVVLDPALHIEMVADGPLGYWPMTDPSASSSAAVYAGTLGRLAQTWTAVSAAPGAAIAFGSGTGPTGVDGPSAAIAPETTSQEGYFLQVPFDTELTGYTIEAWINVAAGNTASASFVATLLNSTQDVVYGGSAAQIALLQSTTGQAVFGTTTSSTIVGPDLRDGGWHQLVLTIDASGNQKQYIDGVAYAGTVAGALANWRPRLLAFAGLGFANLVGELGPVAVFASVLSAARVAAHWNAGGGWYGETVDQRLSRLLQLADVDPGDLDLDVSAVVLNGYQQGGKDALSACGDAVASEGGEAVLYARGGAMTFRGRRFRAPGPPTLTVDVDRDGDRSVQQASLDSLQLTNVATVTRMTGGTQLETVTARNEASIADNGLAGSASVSSWAHLTDAEQPIYVAQYIVANDGNPQFAFDQLAVDLLTAEHALYADVQATQIGSRIRATALPAQSAPASQLDLHVEGWTETANSSRQQVVFDTSAADAPAWGVADDPVYGRAQADGTSTLHAGITAAAGSLQVDTTAGHPLFTTDPAAYPMKIRIGAEVLTATAAPGGASPQTLTVTRAHDGTYASAHSAGDLVDVEPQVTAVL